MESIPNGMTLSPRLMSTYDSWVWLMQNSEKSVDMAALYWGLRDKANYSSSWQVSHFSSFSYYLSIQGQDIFNGLVKTAKRDVKVFFELQ